MAIKNSTKKILIALAVSVFIFLCWLAILSGACHKYEAGCRCLMAFRPDGTPWPCDCKSLYKECMSKVMPVFFWPGLITGIIAFLCGLATSRWLRAIPFVILALLVIGLFAIKICLNYYF